MMENDPDYGYYCETGEDNVTPVKIMHNNLTEMCSMNLHCSFDPAYFGIENWSQTSKIFSESG